MKEAMELMNKLDDNEHDAYISIYCDKDGNWAGVIDVIELESGRKDLIVISKVYKDVVDVLIDLENMAKERNGKLG